MTTTSPGVAICLVDDDPSVRRALRRFLKVAGCAVRDYESAAALLVELDELERDVCIVADVLMPGMDGFALLAAVRARRPSIPVILMSAHDSPQIREQAADSGAAMFFRKPIDGEELLGAVQRLLRGTSGQT